MHYSTTGVHSPQQVLDYIENCQQQYKTQGYGHWAVYSADNNDFVGVCGINRHTVDNCKISHVSYRFTTKDQSKGYATEVTAGVIEYAKRALPIKTLYALVDATNLGSVNVIKKNGFSFKNTTLFRGFKVDVYQLLLGTRNE